MEKALIIGLVVLVTAFGLLYYVAQQKVVDMILQEGFSEVDREAEFVQRVEKNLGFTATEDATYVLQEPIVEWEIEDQLQSAEFKYKVFITGESKVADVRSRFFKSDYKLAFDVTGYYKEENQWRPLLAAAKVGSTMVSEYVIAFNLVDVKGNLIQASDMKQMNDYVQRMAKQLNLTISQTDTVEEALEKAKLVKKFQERFIKFYILQLKADWNKSYKGKDIHDVAMALGLTMEENECYTWATSQTTNREKFFTMFSNENGKEFVPEKMVKNSFKIKGINFAIFVPLTFAPEEIYVNMVKAMKYFKERLGGNIVDFKGNVMKEADFAKQQEEIAKLVKEMEAMGITPGSFKAFSIFD